MRRWPPAWCWPKSPVNAEASRTISGAVRIDRSGELVHGRFDGGRNDAGPAYSRRPPARYMPSSCSATHNASTAATREVGTVNNPSRVYSPTFSTTSYRRKTLRHSRFDNEPA